MYNLRFTKGCYCFLFLLISLSNALSQQKTVFLPLTKLETKDGLSSPNVRKIVQDKYGFMWFSTQDGLNRFDGATFVRYVSDSIQANHTILESDVYDLLEDRRNNTMWCLTAYGGLNKIDLISTAVTASYPLTTISGNTKLWGKCMSANSNNIYIGTDEGFVLKFNLKKNKVDAVLDINKIKANIRHIDKIYADDFGRVWLINSGYGIVNFDSSLTQQISYYSFNDREHKNNTEIQFTDYGISKGNLLICSSYGLVIFDLKTGTLINSDFRDAIIPKEISTQPLQSISVTDNKILVSGHKGLYLINKITGEIKNVILSKNFEDRKWLTPTNSILLTNNTIWIGSQYGVGWIKDIVTPFSGFYNSLDGTGVKIEHSVTLCQADDSTIAICGDDDMYLSNHFTGVIKKMKIPDFYFHAFKAPGNYIIAAGLRTGLRVIDKTGKIVLLQKIFPELMPIQNDLLISSAQAGDSIYYLASQNQKGLYIWNYKTKNLLVINADSKPVSLKSNVINRLYIDKKNLLWILGDNTVAIYDPQKKKIENLTLINPRTNLPLSINMDICENSGKYWIATYGTGIVELNADKEISHIYAAKNGINNLGLYKIFSLNDSLLITSSNSGLSILNVRTGMVNNYFEESGLQSNNFEETSGCVNEDYIFLGGLKGFTKIDKKYFPLPKNSYKLFFSSIQISRVTGTTDTTNLFPDKVVIPDNSLQAIINFSYLNYSFSEKATFRYRLIELGDDWSFLGNRRFVQLIATPHGTYTLQIQASNGGDEWSSPIELKLIFLPKWYQTWWFYLLIAIITAGIIYAFYRYRIRQIEKQHAIRKNIATDLHDDLGSTLNSVKVFTNLAISGVKQEESLQQVKDNLTEATMSLRDMIWVLDDSLDTVDELVTRLKQFAFPITAASNMGFVITAGSDVNSRTLTKEEKRNLFLICKEAINNSIKYSGATQITVDIKPAAKKIQITVADDGKGFDEATVKKGYGLKNMQYRAGQIRYIVKLTSTPGKGTQVEIRLN